MASDDGGGVDAAQSPPTCLKRCFLNSLAFAAGKARDLELAVDIAFGHVAQLGGPHVTAEQGARMFSGNPPIGQREWPPSNQVKGAAVQRSRPSARVTAAVQHLQSVGEKLLAAAGNPNPGRLRDRPQWINADWTSKSPWNSSAAAATKQTRCCRRCPTMGRRPPTSAMIGGHTFGTSRRALFRLRCGTDCGHQESQFSGQTFGSLPATLSSARFVDVPEGGACHETLDHQPMGFVGGPPFRQADCLRPRCGVPSPSPCFPRLTA